MVDAPMQSRGMPSLLFIYLGVLGAAAVVLCLGLTTVMKASLGVFPAGAQEKTSLQLQIERSREIRRALAAPTVTPPLPKITARPAHEPSPVVAEAKESKKPARPRLSPEAMNAMAMDQGAQQQPRADYPIPDRHAPQ